MPIDNRIKKLGRSVFGIIKRPLWEAIYLTTGKRSHLTTKYFDFGMYGGYFEAKSNSVAERLPRGFEVIERRAGFTELEIWCAEYRRMDILRPYNELGVLVPVRFVQNGMPPVAGAYVLQMPVTTEEARWGGVDNYGFPKILAEITIYDENARKVCEVMHRNVPVLTLRVDARPVERFEESARLLNVRDDGRVIECVFDMAGERGLNPTAGGVALELGHHAIADELREIGVRTDGGRGLYVPRARATLGKGLDLGPVPGRVVAGGQRVSAATTGNGKARISP